MNKYNITGYLTPDIAPDASHCRTFQLPDDTLWLANFMGAIWDLADPQNWQKYGELSPEEAAESYQNIIFQAFDAWQNQCILVPAPYWDELTADDADDTAEPETQPWYGEIVATTALVADDLTFIENLRIWIVAGAFLVLTRNVAATIAFVPIARRFTLAFRAHDLGGIVRVFIDAAEVGRVDTYSSSAGVANLNVFMPDDDDHTLWVSMADESNPAVDGDPEIQVIRKRLSEGEVYPTDLRYNSSTNKVQQTADGGSTWFDQPLQDPRHSDGFRVPPTSLPDPKCQSSANIVRFINDVIDETLGVLAAGLDVLGVATSILPFFIELGPFALLFDLAFGLATGLVSLGVDTINDEFTNTVYDDLTCIFFCNLQTDGSLTASGLAQVETDIAATMTADVQLILGAMFLLMGEVGLSNAGAMGDAPADCSGCTGCIHTFCIDFALVDGTAYGVAAVQSATPANTVWSSGLGWVGGFTTTAAKNDVTLDFVFPSTVTLIDVAWDYDKTAGSGANNVNTARVTQPHTSYNVTQVASHASTTLGVNKTNTVAYAGTAKASSIDINSGTVGASVVVRRVKVRYTGAIPSGWSDNC